MAQLSAGLDRQIGTTLQSDVAKINDLSVSILPRIQERDVSGKFGNTWCLLSTVPGNRAQAPEKYCLVTTGGPRPNSGFGIDCAD